MISLSIDPSKSPLKSPLRYPGGKARDLPMFTPYFPANGANIEYREPFLGGGSVLLHALSRDSFFDAYWANDASPDVANFWQVVKSSQLGDLVRLVSELWEPYDGLDRKCPEWDEFKTRYRAMLDRLPDSSLHRAAKFFILNRSTASGLTNSGGMTAAAYKGRFTKSAISRLSSLRNELAWATITQGDYAPLLTEPARNPEGRVFIFLDPPYFSAEKSGLYGRGGDLHKGFDHQRLADTLRDCQHQWLMTIDNCPEIRALYSWAEQKPWGKNYSMANVDGKSKKGAELLIANFNLQAQVKVSHGSS